MLVKYSPRRHHPPLCIRLSSLRGAPLFSLSSSGVQAKSQGDRDRDGKGTENAARARGTIISLPPARAMLRPGAAASSPAAQLAGDRTGLGGERLPISRSAPPPSGWPCGTRPPTLYVLGCLVSSGPGHEGGSLGRFRPGHQGPQRPVAPANSKSCCIRGWPDLCWGHGPQAGRVAQPPHRAARMWTCGSSWAPG